MESVLRDTSRSRISLSRHAAGQEAADRNPDRAPHWPYHGPAGAIWFSDHGIVGDVDPLAPEPYAVVAVLRFPIDIGDDRAVGVGAAWPPPAFEAVEPWLERRVSVATVITGNRVSGEKDGRDQQRNGDSEEIHAASRQRKSSKDLDRPARKKCESQTQPSASRYADIS